MTEPVDFWRHDVGEGHRLAIAGVAILCALLTAVGLVVLRPTGQARADLSQLGVVSQFFDGRILEVVETGCSGIDPAAGVECAQVRLELLNGPDRGEEVTLEFPDSPTTPTFEVGEVLSLGYQPGAEPGFEYFFSDRQRTPILLWLALAFGVAVVVLGRLRGAAALAGLLASLAVLLLFVIPSILDGRDPLAVAVVGASAVAFLALYLAHGFNPMTTVALLGTLASLALTAVGASVVTRLARLSGFVTEEALLLRLASADLDLSGLVLGGIVLGALGAIDDVTVTQASALWELRAARPDHEPGDLYRAGLRIGRAHVASTVNTLVLAYAGASMPLLLLFVLSGQSFGVVANSEVVATEIVRTLVGSMGLVAAVPITTWLAAWAAPPPAGAS